MKALNIGQRGLFHGLQVSWTLGKIIFPVTILVTILQYTPILPWIIDLLSPAMGLIGLPGEAAMALVLGNVLNIYAAIGAIVSFDFTVKEVFIMAMMLSFSHSLLIESSVASRVGVGWFMITMIRLGLAIVSGFLIHHFWNGGSELAQYGFIKSSNLVLNSWTEIFIHGFKTATIAALQLTLIVVPLMIIVQFFRELGWLHILSNWCSPFTTFLGMKKNTSLTLIAGLTIGLAFGAGVMIQAVKEDNVEKKDMILALIFLVTCHAVVEDTVIFIPLGIPVWPLLLIRFITAVILTMIVAFIWNRIDNFTRRRRVRHEY